MGKVSLQAFGAVVMGLAIVTTGCATRSPVEVSGPKAEAAPVMEETEQPGLYHVDYMLVFNHILFDAGKAVLSPEGKAEASKVVMRLKDCREDALTIEGHTNDIESTDAMALGLRRAEAVQRYLVENGVEGERIDAESYGDEQPAVPNTSSQYRQLNRRVVFAIHIDGRTIDDMF
ncbi:MAG: OmpA family protein [Candidatus Hydrogenedentes bacterium]|nr:OmpA family protein [Candidatus Hydrogenedentota bacterium]